MVSGTVAVLILIGVVVGVTVTNGEKELKMLHIIMRHGTRTPADTYPTDPHINDTLYPVGWGQLTNEGKLLLYKIGKYYRERYGKFLGDHYWPDEYYTQSTDSDRAQASMQLINAGLWQPKSVQTWGPLDWQPIPVHYEPLSQDMVAQPVVIVGVYPEPYDRSRDAPSIWARSCGSRRRQDLKGAYGRLITIMAKAQRVCTPHHQEFRACYRDDVYYGESSCLASLLLVRKPCTAYHKERDTVIASEEIQRKLKENQELFDGLTEHTGRTVKDFDDVQDVFSTLKAEEGFNLTLPDWTKEYYPDKMLRPTIFSFILNAWNDKMNRLKGGLLLKKIINDWQSKADGTISPGPRKMFLYGGHDSTIVNFMRALKVWDPQLPDYAITILLEFSKDETGTYGIEVFLRNSTTVPPFRLTIPGCDSFCPLTKLKDLTKEVIPDNWEEECQNDGSYDVPEAGGP